MSGGTWTRLLRELQSVRMYRIVLALIVAAGASAMIRVWWAARPLWGDEGAIALNLRDLSLGDLTGALAYHQVAPIGWLWLEKAALVTLGPDERAIRVISLLAAMAVLVLAPLVARKAGGRVVALAAALLVTASPKVLTYGSELKQYSLEAAVALAMLLVGAWAFDGKRPGGKRPGGKGSVSCRRGGAWVAASAIAVFVSFSAILVLAGVVGGLLLVMALAQRWRDMAWLVTACMPAAALAVVLVHRRNQYGYIPGQVDYFAGGVPPANGGISGVLGWLPAMWTGFVGLTLQWRWAPLVLGCAVVGAVAMWRRGRRTWAAMLVGVFLAAVGAAAVRGYPLAERLAVYLIAPTVILVVCGLYALARIAIRWPAVRAKAQLRAAVVYLTAGALALSAALGGPAVPAVAGALEQTAQPAAKDDLRAGLTEIAGQLRPGDVVLTYYFADKVAGWYAPQLALPEQYVALAPAGSDCDAGLNDVLRGAHRVFYVQGRLHSTDPRNYFQQVLYQLSLRGEVVRTRDVPASARTGPLAWAEVDLTAEPTPPARPTPVPDRGVLGCLDVWHGPA